jgi:hypothetical protein
MFSSLLLGFLMGAIGGALWVGCAAIGCYLGDLLTKAFDADWKAPKRVLRNALVHALDLGVLSAFILVTWFLFSLAF